MKMYCKVRKDIDCGEFINTNAHKRNINVWVRVNNRKLIIVIRNNFIKEVDFLYTGAIWEIFKRQRS